MSIIKKIFFLSLVLLGLFLLSWGVYNLSFRTPQINSPQKEAAQKSTPTPQTSDSKIPTPAEVAQAKIAPITDSAVIAPALGPGGNFIQYFSPTDKKFYQINLDGSGKKFLSQRTFSDISQIFWSPDGTKAILKTQSASDPFLYFNLQANTLTPIKKALDALAWDSTSNKIFYKFFNPQSKNRSLNISNPDTSGWKKLADVAYKDMAIAKIPQTNLVSFWNSGDAYSQTNFQTISTLGGQTQTISQNDFGADYLWAPSGDQVLESHTDTKGGHKTDLALMNYNGGEYTNLDIPTFVSKCAWSQDSQTLYYALPGDIPNDAVLPNDYKNQKFNTADTFWKVNIQTGEKTRLVDLNDIKKKYDATHMFLSQDGSMLFFVNRIDGKLYRINL